MYCVLYFGQHGLHGQLTKATVYSMTNMGVCVHLTIYLNILKNLHQSVTLYVVCLFSSTAQLTYTKITKQTNKQTKNIKKKNRNNGKNELLKYKQLELLKLKQDFSHVGHHQLDPMPFKIINSNIVLVLRTCNHQVTAYYLCI